MDTSNSPDQKRDALKLRVEKLEREKYDLITKVEALKDSCEKQQQEIERNKSKNQRFSDALNTFEQEIKVHKEKRKQEKHKLEKILAKADRLISYFHNGCVVLSKSIGKILHHLLMNLSYDPKEIITTIITEDVQRLYEWIHTLEKNDYLKTKKLFRNISDKVNFYKKIDLNTIKDAYGRISSHLKENNTLAERGEFSMLNATGNNVNTKSRFSVRSVFSNRTNQFESAIDDFNHNILDELNADRVNVDRETITELICRFQERLNMENLGSMPPVLLSDFIQKFKNVAGKLIRSVLLTSDETVNSHAQHCRWNT